MHAQSLQSGQTLLNPTDCLLPAKVLGPWGSSRQKHWSGLPFPPPGDLPDPGTEPASPALAGRFFTTEPPGEAPILVEVVLKNGIHR